MKKLFTLLFSIMLIGSANAQTKQETLKWLNKNKKHITLVNPDGYSSEDFEVEMTDSYIIATTKNNGDKYEAKIYWSNIEEITLYVREEDKGGVSLSTGTKGSKGSIITLHLSKNITEMSEKLSFMVRSYKSVMRKTIDLRDKSLFGN
jgi:hypothetical protein